jgi:hypothetical protein
MMRLEVSVSDATMGLYHLLDGDTNLKYKLLSFLTPNKKISKKKALAFNRVRCCHLALCLWLIVFHLEHNSRVISYNPTFTLICDIYSTGITYDDHQ